MPKLSKEEIEKRTFEVETARGINKADHPSLLALSPKKYMFAILWTDSETIVRNKSQWALDNGINRCEVSQYLGNRGVQEAIRYLDTTIHSAQVSQVLKQVYDQALKGDHRSQKMYLDRFAPPNIGSMEREEPVSFGWDTSLAKPTDPTKESPTPPTEPIPN